MIDEGDAREGMAPVLHSDDTCGHDGRCGRRGTRRALEEDGMLLTLAIILLIAWLLGVVGTYTIGAFVHVLLVIALVLFLVNVISGRRTVV